MEILLVSGQIVCIAGLVYGAWLAISYTQWIEARPPSGKQTAPASDPEELAVWRNYLACDV